MPLNFLPAPRFFLKPQWTAGTSLWPQVRGFLFSDWGLACENFCFDNWGLKETIFPEKNIPGWWLSQPNWKISASQTLGIISRRCGVIRLVFFFQGPTVLCFSCVKLRQMVETQATTLRMDVPGLLGSMVITDRINGLCHLLKKWIAYLGWKKTPRDPTSPLIPITSTLQVTSTLWGRNIRNFPPVELGRYCWWFRNPIPTQPPFGWCLKTL